MSEIVIVSRHRAAVDFIALALAGEHRQGGAMAPCVIVQAGDGGDHLIPVLAEARPEDVRGKHVYGNVPLHLACEAASVTAIEFAGAPPRGQEYGLAEMQAAGARLVRYKVFAAGVGKAAFLRKEAREAKAFVERWPEPAGMDAAEVRRDLGELRRAQGRAEGLRQALAIVTGEAV